jgi:hypothetical protein
MNLLAGLVYRPLARRWERAIIAGEEEKARSLAKLFGRLFPGQPQGAWLEYRTHSEFHDLDDPPTEILRRGWARHPHAEYLARPLAAELTHIYDEEKDDAAKAEALSVIAQYEAVHGAASWTEVERGQMSQVDGLHDEFRAALERAKELLKKDQPPNPVNYVTVAYGYLRLPDGRDEAISLLIEATAGYIPAAHTILYLLYEKRDTTVANAHLQAARLLWRGPQGGFEKFVEENRSILAEMEEKLGTEVF